MDFAELSTPAFFENPYPVYETIRGSGPLVPLGPKAFISGRYRIVDALLHDRRLGKDYLETVRVRYGDRYTDRPIFDGINRMMVMMNPPAHTRLRSLMMQAFNARQVERIREIAMRTADRLASALEGKRDFDLVSEFALPLPVEIICGLLDLPTEHAAMLGDSAREVAQVFDTSPLSPQRLDAACAAYQKLESYFSAIVKARRNLLGNDLISALLSAEEGGATLSDEEILSNVMMLFAAGHETTSNMIGNALIALHRHPLQLKMLRDNPSRLPKAINECVRYDSSVQTVTRTAFEDVEVEGIKVPRNTVIFLMLGAANRDPEQFSNPDELHIDREQGRVQSFGGGIHYCLGARLAALELEVAIGTLLSRFPRLRLLELENLRWHPRHTLRGVQKLLAQA